MNAMVELCNGYGDGYGIVAIDDDGQPVVKPGRKVKTYSDGWPMEAWRRKLLAQSTVSLIDRGVSVPAGAVLRVIGPLDCPEAARIRAARYMRNSIDRTFIDKATDAEIVAAMSHEQERDTYAAMKGLWKKYQMA